MDLNKHDFSILITTKNRCSDLIFTLNKIKYLIETEEVECVVFDDGSIDGTFEKVKRDFPGIKIFRNESSKGYLYCRNKMLNETQAKFAISLDDDAHFVTENPLNAIRSHFDENKKCGLIALRIFWGLDEPVETISTEKSQRVKGFVGCGHVWRMSAWRDTPNYPEWFEFYGEEDFSAMQLFKRNWEVHYFPEVLINHRVNIKARKKNADYAIRLQRSLRAGWYLYFLFLPLKVIPRKMAYSIWMQLKLKVFKGDFKALKALIYALFNLIVSIPKIIKNKNRFTDKEFDEFQKLDDTRIYWQPEKK
ncbi:glycosyltransferase family 2 protein [[Flexibacter] sp. ATCC 35103]|uniref:glycosyltransferase family 2 protein n=1 Tax=[Flexibacter] sp. ATCC 35103 TaxID=1937528 RepID=UPI0009D5A744|nr:glycosyltransferase [[Flexibacter] sp. ATCC 35103]OMQ09875.1 glycosyl transferase [[Flexibacter] sp. ATCC 35103]